MLGPPKSRHLDEPIRVSLDDLAPESHFYRHLERTLDLAFVRDLLRATSADGGLPSIDPVMFFKLQRSANSILRRGRCFFCDRVRRRGFTLVALFRAPRPQERRDH